MAEEKAAAPTGPTPGGKPAGAAPEARPAAARKKGWKTVSFARVHIQSSFNNTIVTITDERGEVLTWASGGSTGFKGTRKGTPFAAQMTSTKAARRAVELGVKQVAVYVSGPGPGRETAIRALQTAGLTVITIKDVTPLPHNGCRRPKARRV